MGQQVVSSYLRSKLSSILEEAEADSGSPSHIISRFRSIQSQIESTEASLIPVDLLYDLIEALSECRVFAYQRRTPRVSEKGFNLNKLYHRLSELMFRRRIRKRLDTIDKNLRAPSSGDSRPPAKLDIPLTRPIPDTSLIIGLDAEAEKIEAWLMATASSEALRAVGIVGRCGCGKTALAQKVFASPKVVQEFSPRIWVCLSNMLFDNYRKVKVLKSILGDILPRDKLDDSESNFDKLLDMLQKELIGKKYLIVLDDAWRLPGDPHFLSQGLPKGSGGALIVTGRRKDVISQMVGDEHVIRLEPGLSGEICWQILSTDIQQQGKMEDIRPKLSIIKDDAKRNFDGLPLVAKSFATMLPDLLKEEVKVADQPFSSAILQVLFQQLTSAAIKGLASREKVESHFEKLKRNLAIIQAVLEDAEEKQLTQKSVKLWLESFWNLAYDLENILDEITTQALVQHSKRIQQSRAASMVQKLFPASMVQKLFPAYCSFSPDAIVSNNHKMMSKIKEFTIRLQFIVKQSTDLGLVENPGGPSNRPPLMRTPTTSLVNESQVYGRDEDKEAITKMLLMGEECHDGVSVITIVGMGGLGKTTLAQLVYNDRNVKQSFHKRAWVCVSDEFDVISITRTLYESITGEPAQSKGLDMLQVRLKEELGKSKFLIVLDDVWNDNYGKWDDLRRPFQFGAPGSRIIVTTRNESVASVVGLPRTAYHMKLLTDEDCLSLLALHSGAFHENSELKEVGLGLVKKCKGLPLAAKTLGGLLRSKETKEEWCAVLNSKVWDLPEENILPVLRLSYRHLPSHLKHLFAYCSIFPKDYDFKKNELVYLWMGEGFLEKPNESKSKEELGLDYFNELLSRSFFQRSSESDEYFVMHGLINDLAQFVAGGTYYCLDEKMDTNQEYKIPEKARHGSFLRHEYEVFRKFKAFNQAKGLRTFLPMPVENSLVWPPFYLSNKILAELVPELLSLRVLSLSGYSITELPSSICNLLHLRYLNLSGTSIITLPDTLGDIYNLQTLSLHKCRSLCKLPSTLGKLSNLRHLDNSDTDQLKDMPIEIGQLSNLQTLPKIVLSKTGGLGLRELRGLKHLRGSLSILELQNVTNIEDVKDAILFTHKLDELQLTWGSDVDQTRDRSAAEKEVLDHLRPCDENLRSLKIVSYGGFSFPSWIGLPSFRNLSSICILSCLECKSLPSLGQLPELKHLLIGSMPNIKCISTEFYGSGVMVPFPKLETLRFDHMPEWEEWAAFADGEDIKFPHLHQLTMSKCSKLTRVSPLNFPVLRELDLEECKKVLLESFSDLDSLNSLKVEAITGLSYLPRELTLSLSALEVLECCSCSELLSLWPNETPLEHLTHLKRLVIADCEHLVSLGQGEQQFPSELEVLEVFRCANLITLPNDLSDLSSLRELIIKNCLKFISFPESGLPLMLKRLEILSCIALESLPSNMSDLERLEIKDCSSLKTFARDGFPVSLKKLAIKNCTQLGPVSEMMFPENSSMMLEDLSLCTWPNFSDLLQRLHGFSHIAELYLSSCYGLRHFPEQGLPPSLRALSIEDCANLKSLPAKIRSMTSLVSLELRSCPRLDNFPKWDLPPNLSSLRIWDSKKFKPLEKWGLHRLTSLREFSICGGFKELEVLGHGNDLFPPSLIRFSIARFPQLTSLFEVLEKLTSLRHLSIMNCANLNDLPSEGLLEKLWNLEISDCPLLKPKCMRDKGEYWPKISGIPCVEIDGTYIYKQSSV